VTFFRDVDLWPCGGAANVDVAGAIAEFRGERAGYGEGPGAKVLSVGEALQSEE